MLFANGPSNVLEKTVTSKYWELHLCLALTNTALHSFKLAKDLALQIFACAFQIPKALNIAFTFNPNTLKSNDPPLRCEPANS